MSKDAILLKLSGEIFIDSKTKEASIDLANSIAKQIIALSDKFYFAVVIGGGNFFRGNKDSKALDLDQSYGHYIGMLATQMNGLILKNCFNKNNLNSKLLSALPSPAICETLSQDGIHNALKNDEILIFAGGLGSPFFSTDTTAVVRALQINAKEVWKCTNTDGIYDKDPAKFKDAKLLKEVNYTEALDNNFQIMDSSAFALARDNKLKIRVFNIFEEDALIKISKNNNIGTTVY
ncbi:UMP kinase [candidate division TM6 bacterium RIFCSPHIGHO2_12_FULL_32_22]|nr:MAG: UMP kinase [candidate division TM6 bacterium RIFCSPHIGHO2_12_FULL_32_22]